MGFPGSSAGKESACNVGNPCSIPGWGRFPGGRHASYSSILAWRIPMDRGAWWVTYSSWGHKESDTTERLSTAQCVLLVYLAVPGYTACFGSALRLGSTWRNANRNNAGSPLFLWNAGYFQITMINLKYLSAFTPFPKSSTSQRV